MRAWTPLILLGTAALVFLCLADELTYRWIRTQSVALPVPTWASDADLIYRLNPANPASPGSFRWKAPRRKQVGSVRIVCIGGSTTYGHGLAAEDAWPAVLERDLRQENIPAEVVNAGVPGYGSHQNLVRYQRDIAPLSADVVLIYEGWNRTGALVDPAGFVPYAVPRPGSSWLRRMSSSIARHSLLLQTFVSRAQLRTQKAPAARWSADPYQDVFVSDVNALVARARSRGQTPVLILYPSLYYAGISHAEAQAFSGLLWDVQAFRTEMLGELEQKHTALRQVAMSTGSLAIDMQTAFAGVQGYRRRALFLDSEHLSAAGSAKLAAILCDRLVPLLRSKMAAGPTGISARKSNVPGRRSHPSSSPLPSTSS